MKVTRTLLRKTLFALAALPAFFSSACKPQPDDHDWPVYLGDNASSQYSEADQITPENVHKLEIAWTFDGGGAGEENRTIMECNPLIIGGVVYATNVKRNLYAIDGANGKELWKLNPFEELSKAGVEIGSIEGVSRGLNYWADGKNDRLLYTVDYFLMAVDPRSGTLIKSFGDQGMVDLKPGLGRDISTLSYNVKTPGVIYKNLLILGSSVSERIPAAPGHIRAFDVVTGKQVWRFNTIPQPGEFGYDTWPKDAYKEFGGANVWTGMALDEERGLVYCPTGSATFDFYGGDRIGENLFANTLLCLDAETGKRVWHYQIVRHDLHDYDLPSPPNLLTIRREGKEIPAVAQLTKQGYIFVFNRVTGEPLFPIEEIPVPPSDIPGEIASHTQPRPTKPEPYVREVFSPDLINDVTPEIHAEVLAKYSTMEPHLPFRSPSLTKDTIVHPGMIGGLEWGGGATDKNGIIYFNSNESTAILTIIDATAGGSPGETIYKQNCIACHGPDLRGGTAFGQVVPSLVGIAERKDSETISRTIMFGGTTMPGFRHLSGKDVFYLLEYLKAPGETGQHAEEVQESDETVKKRFIHTGNNIWRTSQGYPAIKPPWGTINALDLNTGEYLWRKTFGEYPELMEQGMEPTGRTSYGGPVVTAGGLLFIGASLDNHLRAYDLKTGEELWRTLLPAGGYATPATYTIEGKQYVVIACGGGRGAPAADKYVAYALP
jgi:quinoprotein glucose dehydrogenase